MSGDVPGTITITDANGNPLVTISQAGIALAGGAKMRVTGLVAAPDDAAAKAAGVPVNTFYRSGSVVKVRVLK